MFRLQLCTIFTLCCLYATFHSGESLKCYTCATRDDPSCNDPFNATLTRVNPWGNVVKQHPLLQCGEDNIVSSPANLNRKPVCFKQISMVGDVRKFDRGCRWENSDQAMGTCPTEAMGEGVKVEFCGTCEEDGCNAAPGSLSMSTTVQIVALVPALFAVKYSLF